ncbi:hypothetical protein ACVGWR_00175, partial [Enterobacter hormaechei]
TPPHQGVLIRLQDVVVKISSPAGEIQTGHKFLGKPFFYKHLPGVVIKIFGLNLGFVKHTCEL